MTYTSYRQRQEAAHRARIRSFDPLEPIRMPRRDPAAVSRKLVAIALFAAISVALLAIAECVGGAWQ